MRHIPIIATLAALLGLLAYSLERTVWLFQRFEVAAEPAWAAAIVVELAAVALIISAGALPEHARPWGNRALLAVLSVQALANLSAGYLRGGRATLGLFGTADEPSAYAVASVLWLVTNLAIPGLVLSLSKVLEQLIKSALEVSVALSAQIEPALALASETDTSPVFQALPLEARDLPALEMPALAALDDTLASDDDTSAQLRAATSGHVYFLHAEGIGTKIGCATDVARRVREIAGFVPFDVELLHSIPADNMYALESEIHRYFELAGKRLNGEWFRLDPFDLQMIKRADRSSVSLVFASASARLASLVLSDVPLVDNVDSSLILSDTAKRYACPHCGAALKSKQARGAAVSNGHCPSCKGARDAR